LDKFRRRCSETLPNTALAKGEGIRTTYGTDFDCVAASILERNYPKAVACLCVQSHARRQVITDGYADMTEEHMEALRKRKVSILTVIFGDGDEECEALKPFGPIMKLEDVVEACGSGYRSPRRSTPSYSVPSASPAPSPAAPVARGGSAAMRFCRPRLRGSSCAKTRSPSSARPAR
jgi:hypothetical protein